ncbi:hypothetical protein [Dongia rigui]|uniref:Uncharacterized protein n=1 Tax=Dongia rigui TaxID=940149 RepID=A0ABU5E0I2_9PROT|nr:hypothetical protein [Dongia rigui]MDY0872690.1 hypothetical protein [Dongia rigui]
MKQGNGSRRKVQALKGPRGSQIGGTDGELEVKALEALRTAYKRLSRVLSDEIDRSRKNVDRMSDLGGRLRWVAERHSMVHTALAAGPAYAAYLCGECDQLPEVRSLAEMAAKMANDGNAYPTALNLLNYIDHELGWMPIEKSA